MIISNISRKSKCENSSLKCKYDLDVPLVYTVYHFEHGRGGGGVKRNSDKRSDEAGGGVEDRLRIFSYLSRRQFERGHIWGCTLRYPFFV